MDTLSPEDLTEIKRALKVWVLRTHFTGDPDVFLSYAWEAWKDGRELGYAGGMLINRIVWRLQDALRKQTSPLCLLGDDLELFGGVTNGLGGGEGVVNDIWVLQEWAIKAFPELTPVWTLEVPLVEIRDLTKASRRTKWYLSGLGQGKKTGIITETNLTGVHVTWGRSIALNRIRKMRLKLVQLKLDWLREGS